MSLTKDWGGGGGLEILPSSASEHPQQHPHWHPETLLALPNLGGLIQSGNKKCKYRLRSKLHPQMIN